MNKYTVTILPICLALSNFATSPTSANELTTQDKGISQFADPISPPDIAEFWSFVPVEIKSKKPVRQQSRHKFADPISPPEVWELSSAANHGKLIGEGE